MSNFNLNDYETVKERKARFYKDNPDGRIVVSNITPTDNLMEFALYEASVFINREDQLNNVPRGTGTAMEIRDKELSINKYGKEYESVNYSSWTENCEESAVGRALDNAGYSGNKKCSREEIEKSQRMAATIQKSTYQDKLKELGMELSQKKPLCPNCEAEMIPFKRKDGTGNAWFCPNWKEKNCKPIDAENIDIAGNFI